MLKTNLIGLSGVAGAGKDTFCSILKQILNSYEIKSERIAFADKLKEELHDTIQSNFGIDLFSCSREEKDLIRPILIGWGEVRRIQSKGSYWASKLDSKINSESVSILTDVRFKEFDYDETDWVKSRNGIIIHIKKYHNDYWNYKKHYTKAVNSSEQKNDPVIQSLADYSFEWEESNDNSKNYTAVWDFAKSIGLI